MPSRLPAVGLAIACVVPVLAGVYLSLTILLEWDWKFNFSPEHVDRLPILVHVVASAAFYLLGTLQVLPGFRSRHPLWHRKAGKATWVAGLLGALSATWLSSLHTEISGPILLWGRLVFGPLWALFLVFGLLSMIRRDFVRHGEWMVRAFAVAMPAGTLIFIAAPFYLVLGELPTTLDESIQACAWIVHLGIAEILIRRWRRTRFRLENRQALVARE